MSIPTVNIAQYNFYMQIPLTILALYYKTLT